MAIAKEQIRQIIADNNFTNVADMYDYFKKGFKNILQELMEAEMVSKITDKILPEIKEWQSRPLDPIYPFVFMDCIHYKVREDGRILSRAAYVIMGVTVDGYKDILSVTVGANETLENPLSPYSFDIDSISTNAIFYYKILDKP